MNVNDSKNPHRRTYCNHLHYTLINYFKSKKVNLFWNYQIMLGTSITKLHATSCDRYNAFDMAVSQQLLLNFCTEFPKSL